MTSYVELALASQAADLAHPAFGKLFLETEFVPASSALLCHRRPRRRDRSTALGLSCPESRRTHAGADRVGHGPRAVPGPRARSRSPAALDGRRLSETAGVVLDPIFSLRQRIRLVPGATVRMSFATGVADDRDAAHALAQKYRDPVAAMRAFTLALAHQQSTLHHLAITADDALLFERLASRVLFLDSSLLGSRSVLERNHLGQPGLWRHSISGDLPILLVGPRGPDALGLVREVLQAQEYWRLKGLRADVVILNEEPPGYLADAQTHLTALLDAGPWRAWRHRPAGVFLIRDEDHGDGADAARVRRARGASQRCRRSARATRSAVPGDRAAAVADRRDAGDHRPAGRVEEPVPLRRAGSTTASAVFPMTAGST